MLVIPGGGHFPWEHTGPIHARATYRFGCDWFFDPFFDPINRLDRQYRPDYWAVRRWAPGPDIMVTPFPPCEPKTETFWGRRLRICRGRAKKGGDDYTRSPRVHRPRRAVGLPHRPLRLTGLLREPLPQEPTLPEDSPTRRPASGSPSPQAGPSKWDLSRVPGDHRNNRLDGHP